MLMYRGYSLPGVIGPSRIWEDIEENWSMMQGAERPDYGPTVNVYSDDDSAIITAELPGIDMDKMEISIEGDQVVLRGGVLAWSTPEGYKVVRQEAYNEEFYRVFRLPFRIDNESAEASYDRGILTVTLPKARQDALKRIEINVTDEKRGE